LLSLDNLPVGVNVITLNATNSVGVSAATVVTVTVDDDLNLPGPTLTVGPAQVGWQVDNGATAPLAATLSINNAGSGALAWTASEDAPWLTLDVLSGTVTATGDASALTLTANPSGLAGDTSHTAQVIITKPAAGSVLTQTVQVPVTLSIGDVRNVAAVAAPQETPIFLPHVEH
jgi:hypothetical protein